MIFLANLLCLTSLHATWSKPPQLGFDSTFGYEPYPVRLETMDKENVVDIACGDYHTLFLNEAGQIFSAGWASFQLSVQCRTSAIQDDRQHQSTSHLHLVDGLNDVKICKMSAGRRHNGVISTCHKLYTWGVGENYQLGHGGDSDQWTPKQVSATSSINVLDIACGWGHNVILVEENDQTQVLTWGWGEDGQLGHGDMKHQQYPKIVKDLQGIHIAAIAVGSDYTLLLDKQGQVYGFGSSKNDPKMKNKASLRPELIPFPLDAGRIVDIASGDSHYLALSDDGDLFTWGWNSDGQCGQNHTLDVTHPTKVPRIDGKRWTHAAGGRVHSLAMTGDGNVYSWGSAIKGRLGNGSKANVVTPEWIELDHFKAIKLQCGKDHSIVLGLDQPQD